MCCAQYGMAKILCEFKNGKQIECKVTENMGFQGGDYVKAVMYEDKERIVVKRGNIWKPKTIDERCGVARSGCGVVGK